MFIKIVCGLLVLLPYSIATESDDQRPAKQASTMTSNKGLPEVSETLWLRQKLDHSDLTNTETWKQRYFINKTHYTGSGPVFLKIGGAREIDVVFIESGPWLDYARRTKALLVCVEHRYFGDSHPLDDLSTENLVYLTNEQVLADLGYFIVRIRKLYSKYIPSKAKWIAFGGFNGGSLAVRLRMKFPHLVYAAVASSAPLLEIANFRGFYEFIDNEAEKYEGIKATIKEAFTTIRNFIKDDNKVEELKKKFNMCSSLNEKNKHQNVKLFFWMLVHFLARAVQFRTMLTNIEQTVQYKPNALNRIVVIIKTLVFRNYEKCLLVDYETAVAQYKDPSWDAETKIDLTLLLAIGNRQNLYQRCTEYGQFPTSEQEDSLFGDEVKMEFYTRLCEDVFGNEFNSTLMGEGVERANIYYGGMDIKVSHVLFVNGIRNPWHLLTVTGTEETEDRIAINISNMESMEDLKFSKKHSVRQAQKMIFDKLEEWLG